MKILLINPPRSPWNSIREFAPAQAKRFIHQKLVGPPLGLLTVAGAVRGHDVSVLDMKGEYDLRPDAPGPGVLTRQWLESVKPDVVGVTIITSEFNASCAIAREAKTWNPHVLTVAGGLHTTLCPQDFVAGPFDVVCPGLSAHRFRSVVEAREEGWPLDKIPGLLLNTPAGCVSTGEPGMEDAAGADFVSPPRHYLRPWLSTYVMGGSPKRATYLFTSLGCPHRCTFCSIWPQFAGRFFQRRVESIVDELKHVDEYGIVRFADANTVVDVDFITRLFDRLEYEGIRKEYVMDMRADTAALHPNLIRRLAKAGLKVVICGFESFREHELRRYNKSLDARRIQEAVEIMESSGILVRGNYVVPPDYTADDFYALADYASTHRVTYAGYTVLTPMPGTPMHTEMRERIADADLDKYNFFNCVLNTALPREEFYRRLGELWMIKRGTEII